MPAAFAGPDSNQLHRFGQGNPSISATLLQVNRPRRRPAGEAAPRLISEVMGRVDKNRTEELKKLAGENHRIYSTGCAHAR